MKHKIKQVMDNKYAIGVITFAISFIVYLKTLCPTVYWGDSGELIAAAHTLGIAHPSGYPTYTLLGKIFTLIPIGSIALRLNLMSALFASLTVALLYFVCYKLTRSRITSFAFSCIFAFSFTFWSQAVVAEVYTLNSFFVALCVLLLLQWREHGQEHRAEHPEHGACASREKWLYLFFFVYGLSLTHHLSMVLLLPGFIYLILVREHSWLNVRWDKNALRPSIILMCVGLFLLGTLPYAYLPLRSSADPFLDWGNPETMQSFVGHITAKDYRSYFSVGMVGVLDGIKSFSHNLYPQFGILSWILLVFLLASMRSSRNAEIVFLWFALLAYSAYSIIYQVFNSAAQMIPLILVISILGSIGFMELLKYLKSKRTKRLCALLLLLVPVLLLVSNFAGNDLSSNDLAEVYGKNILRSATEINSIIITKEDNNAFPLYYLQKVEHYKEEVCVLDYELLVGTWYVEGLPRRCPGVELPSVEFLAEAAQKSMSEEDLRSEMIGFIVSHNTDRQIYLTLNSFSLPEKVSEKLVLRDHLFSLNRGDATYSPVSFGYADLEERFDDRSREVVSKMYIYHGVYLVEEDLEGAISCFRSAAEIKQDSFDAWNDLGIAYYKKGENEKAIDAWERALEIREDAGIRKVLGVLKGKQNG